jgi:uncharacterized membrane protein
MDMAASDQSDPEPEHSPALPGALGKVPADLAVVVAAVLVTVAVALTTGSEPSVPRVVLGLLFVLFIPGYAVVAALFPERDRERDSTTEKGLSDRRIGGVERITLSLGMSLGMVPLLALLVNFLSVPFGLFQISAAVGGVTVVASVVAVRRRLALPADRRFRVPYRRWLRAIRPTAGVLSRTDAVVTVLLIVSILVAGVGVAQTLTSPQHSERYTEFYVLSGDVDGVGQATNFTTNLSVGEASSVLVGIGNQEHRAVDYTVVVQLAEMRVQGNASTVVSTEELTRVGVTVEHNRTEERRVSFTPTERSEALRLQFLLYRGTVPADPSVETAYRETHLWVGVS